MVDKIQAIRGMNDILPNVINQWQRLEVVFSDCVTRYAYQEIRFPLVESTHLFKRTIGEITDIVEKEMYTFNDLSGDSITLRPEGTAGCVRACLEHGLLHNQQQKLWYKGPMFRYEKPQKGRYRQFNQFGVEAFGMPGYAIELEMISMTKRLWTLLGIENAVHLQINTLGEYKERQAYKESLVNYLNQYKHLLDTDSQRRLDKNPLRILDSKHPATQEILRNAPSLLDSLSHESKNHFKDLCQGLKEMDISFTINPLLVRGLDYYGHTVFEWVTDKLGSQATVCAGGRYDRLVEQLGGDSIPAIGFAMGAERLILLMETLGLIQNDNPSVPSLFLMTSVPAGMNKLLAIAEELRDSHPKWRITTNTVGGSFKSQFKKADKSGADFAIILGENELINQQISIKNLRQKSEQVTLPYEQLEHYLNDFIG